MKSRLIASLLLTAALTLAAAGGAAAEDKVVKIGVLSDQSGLYADLAGPGSTLAAQMAVEDSGLTGRAGRSTSSPATTRTSPISAPRSRGNGSTSTRST